MDCWDDLFAAASGGNTEEKYESGQKRKHSDDSKTNNKDKKKRKKKKSKNTTQSIDNTSFGNVNKYLLRSRINFFDSSPSEQEGSYEPSWPSFLVTEEFEENKKRSPLHQPIKICLTGLVTSSDKKPLELFACIRNIRCLTMCSFYSIFGIEEDSSCSFLNSSEIKSYLKLALLKAKKLLEVFPTVTQSFLLDHPGENNLLNEKLTKVHEYVSSLNTSRKNNLKRDAMFGPLVKIICACDDAYYRLYYLQITGLFPIIKMKIQKNNSEQFAHIPHPTTYFGTNYLSWDVLLGHRCKKDFLKFIKSDLSSTDSSSLTKNYNVIFERFGVSDDNKKNLHQLDPLTFLHSNRYMESMVLFWKSNWVHEKHQFDELVLRMTKFSSHNISGNQSNSTQENEESFYQKHETPAPNILMTWRDCCRDFLCNLFAYATIPPPSITKILHNLISKHDLNNLIDFGCGSGYIASLLQDSLDRQTNQNLLGIKEVIAFDVTPSSSSSQNEYHGKTPAYFSVQEGNVQTLSHFFKGQESKARNSVLFLCYPPPLSTMAEDALRVFIKQKGCVFIHIGEFNGLTGSRHFESMLLKEFTLQHRMQCLQWGTDSSEITIWEKRETKSQKSSLLLPCSMCFKRESTRRHILSRSLTYCSEVCYVNHTELRNVQLKLSLIPSPEKLDAKFEDCTLEL